MLSHINRTCSTAFYYHYNIRRIRKYLSRPVTESLVHAFITNRVDYCNSLLYGLPNSHIMKLQRIQNAATRLLTGTPRFFMFHHCFSLLGRKPEELSNSELKFCRGDTGKGLKTKAELVIRVYDYIKTGKDKEIVDPEPHKIYSHRKEKQNTSTDHSNDSEESVEFSSTGWESSLEKMLMFTRVEIVVMKSGKASANKDHHTVLTSLIKARRFLDDEYLKEIECASDSKHFFFKGKRCHSFRKSEPPQNLKICLCVVTGEVKSACCSCVAEKSGFV